MRFIRQCRYKAILAFAPGVGKTIPAIRTAVKAILAEQSPVLIVCRRDDYLTWKLELEEEGKGEYETYFVDKGPRVDKKGRPKHPLPDYAAPSGPQFFAVTYDLFKNKAVFNWVRSRPWSIILFDELHYLKRWKSQRTKKVFRATLHISRRLGLTGTLISNDPEDIYAQVLCVDLGKTFGKSEWWFKKRYYLREGFGWYLKRGAKDTIATRLRQVAMSVQEDDVLDLPPRVDIIKSCPMSPQQKKLYEEVLTNWEIELQDGTYLEINQVVVQLQKLRQIASGFYYKEDKEPVYIPCPKSNLLDKVIRKDLHDKKKIIIWGAHKAELARIADNLRENGENYATYFGQMSIKKREEARISFRDDPRIRFFVGQVDRGVGMNELVVADTAIYNSNSLKVLSKQQSLRRHRRRGSERHERIYNYELITEGSVDEKLLKNIGKSISLADYILNQLKRGVALRKLV